MTTAAEYQQRIATYDRSRVLELWGQIEASNTPDWEPGTRKSLRISDSSRL